MTSFYTDKKAHVFIGKNLCEIAHNIHVFTYKQNPLRITHEVYKSNEKYVYFTHNVYVSHSKYVNSHINIMCLTLLQKFMCATHKNNVYFFISVLRFPSVRFSII